MTSKFLRAAALALVLAVVQISAAGVQQFANNAVSVLAAPVTTGATSLSVTSGTGALFPNPTGGNWFIGTLQHIVGTTVTALEIVKVTARSGDNMTIVRAQEGTTARTWSAGDTFALLPTAGGLSQFVQPAQAQASSYNYAFDVGAANAYAVNLSPPLSAHITGMPIRFLAAHTNTGSSTFNDGAGAVNIQFTLGSNLAGGEILAGQISTVVWDGSEFELQTPNNLVRLALPGGTSATQTVQGAIVTNGLGIIGDLPLLSLWDNYAASNNGFWYLQPVNGQLNIITANDTGSFGSLGIGISRSGTTVTGVQLGGTSQTGTTQTVGDATTNLATTLFVANALFYSPALGGTPTAPTAAAGTATTQVATTAFVQQDIGATTIGYQPTGVSGIGVGYTAVIGDVALVPGQYALVVDGDLVTSGSVGTLSSRVIITTGTGTGNPVATIGGGLNLDTNNSNVTQEFYGNAAGLTGMSIYTTSTQHVVLRGTFTMPAGATSVTYEMATSGGTLTAAAGTFASFTRIN